MTNDNREFLLQRFRYLTEERRFLEADISLKLERLKAVGTELSSVTLALQENQDQPKSADVNIVNRVQKSPQSTGYYTRNGVKIRRGSIKDYVVQVLSDSQKGMVALDILAAINERFEKNYDRTSLSPQLSRLRQDGVLGLRGPVWYLARDNSDLI